MKRKVAFLFPGLGEQYTGMAGDLYRTESVFRAYVDRCSEIVEPLLGVDLREVLYPAGHSPAPSKEAAQRKLDLRSMVRRGNQEASLLDRTELAQPATFVVEYALAQLWKSKGVAPDAMLGYSIGEYVAACLADVVSLPDALRLVTLRAKLIQGFPAGAMLAVPRAERDITPWLTDGLSLAAVNGDALCILAGSPEAIDAAQARLLAEQQPAIRIPTTHAFHSSMMVPIATKFEELASTCSFRAPRIPYISNVTGAWITEAQATDPAYWAAHLCKPVRFSDGLRALSRDPARVFLEVGPGRSLATLALHLGSADGETFAFPSLRASYEATPDAELLSSTHEKLRALEERRPRPRSFSAYALPMDDLERNLVALWQEALSVDTVGVHDNFFELGGHSLLAIFVTNRLHETMGLQVPLSVFFGHPTIAQLARALQTNGPQPSSPDTGAAHLLHSSQYALPNGLEITHQNKAETDHFYEDIFEHRTYVRHLKALPENACVFDVGANIGLFSLFIHTLDRKARTYAFEPSPPTFDILRANVAKHGVNAKIFPVGLSRDERTADFTFYPLSSGMSSVYGDRAEEEAVLRAILQNRMQSNAPDMAQIAAHTEELIAERLKSQRFTCRLRTISNVIREEGVERIDLLKIDVQKSELDVLMGIRAHDWGKIQSIAIEVHDTDGRVEIIEKLLKEHAYDVEIQQDDLYRGSGIYLMYGTRSAA